MRALRVYGARDDDIDGDAEARHFEGHRARETDEPQLRADAVRTPDLAPVGVGAAEIDDAAPFPFDHARQHGLAQKERRLEVGVEDEVPFFERDFRDPGVRPDRRIVDENVDTAVVLFDSFHERRQTRRIREVNLIHCRVPADGLDFGAHFVGFFGTIPIQHDGRYAFPGERQHDTAPDVAVAARDDRDAAGDAE